jgi:cholesterol transport system auxiliary component
MMSDDLERRAACPHTGRATLKLWLAAVVTLLAALSAGCAGQRAATPNFYSFDNAWLDSLPTAAGAPSSSATPERPLPTLIVNPVQAAAGYDSAHIVYRRAAQRQEYYAYNEWVDTPARMLAPPLMTVLARTGAFRAVVPTPSAAAGDLRLDVEIVQLQHDFTTHPSRTRLLLRVYMVDDTTRRVLAWRDIQAEAPAPGDDPAGGVAAANQAVQQALRQLAQFCAEVARDWRPAPGTTARAP